MEDCIKILGPVPVDPRIAVVGAASGGGGAGGIEEQTRRYLEAIEEWDLRCEQIRTRETDLAIDKDFKQVYEDVKRFKVSLDTSKLSHFLYRTYRNMGFLSEFRHHPYMIYIKLKFLRVKKFYEQILKPKFKPFPLETAYKIQRCKSRIYDTLKAVEKVCKSAYFEVQRKTRDQKILKKYEGMEYVLYVATITFKGQFAGHAVGSLLRNDVRYLFDTNNYSFSLKDYFHLLLFELIAV
jgi:hypothetical protein